MVVYTVSIKAEQKKKKRLITHLTRVILVLQRLAANVGTKHRGRLSVMAQSLCDVRIVYEVPSSVFVPIPKVDDNPCCFSIYVVLLHFNI